MTLKNGPMWNNYTASLRQIRAGFSLSRALFRKKMCGPLIWGGRPYFSWKKTGDLFLLITVAFIHFISIVHSGVAHYFRHAKNSPLLLWGPLFVGPLFGRTCWTCLNPPLRQMQKIRTVGGTWNVCLLHKKKDNKKTVLQGVYYLSGYIQSGPIKSKPQAVYVYNVNNTL